MHVMQRLLRKDTIELQRHHIERLRLDMEDAEKFRKIYNYTFDYARSEGQKSMRALLVYQHSGSSAFIDRALQNTKPQVHYGIS